jgi:hypothetical protein
MRVLTILCLMLVATKFAMSLAHVLELPGKLRLDEATYRAVQAIYYPGFTVAGFVGEFGGMVALAALLYLTPYGTNRFWWTAAALGLLIAGHATYWLFTHPVNKFWVKDIAISAPGSTFFSLFASGEGNGHWTELRNVWEFSHVVIACFATLSLLSIGITTSLLPNKL